MNEPHSNDQLEADELRQSAPGFDQGFHAAVEAQDRQHCHDEAYRMEKQRPEMSVSGPQGGFAVCPCSSRCLEDDDRHEVKDRELEDCNPGTPRPIAFALFRPGFLLRFDGVEELFAKSTGGRSCELDVEEEEGAEADCFVERADGVDVLRY